MTEPVVPKPRSTRSTPGASSTEQLTDRFGALEAELADARNEAGAVQLQEHPATAEAQGASSTAEAQPSDVAPVGHPDDQPRPTNPAIDDAERRAQQIIYEATAYAERLRADARADADRIRREAQHQAKTMLNEMGTQLADMGDAYREAIREARKTVYLMADSIRGVNHTGSATD